MTFRLFALLVSAALVACASGSTIRATDGDDGGTNRPVSLAPEPSEEAQAEPAPATEPGSVPSQPPAEQPQAVAQPAQGYAPYASTRTIDIRRLGQWTRTGIGESRRLVIRNANAWAQFWSELGVGEQPNVDFTRDVVVAVAAGQRSTGGFEIAVDRITQTDGELSVEVVERTPGPNCITTTSLTQPVDVVVVPVADARSWSFMERKEIRACR
jgi:hypothetical protein